MGSSAAERFDAVVVGSGFGGAVSACRLAEAGMRVCVLERGQAWPPGSFARTPAQMRSNFWDPAMGLHGLFQLWSFRGLDALVASGLGGGSLIYANVLLRTPSDWFVHPDGTPWPITRADLDPHYARVEESIGVQRYPQEGSPYDRSTKTRAFQRAAEDVGLEWFMPNLAITFANRGEQPAPGAPINPQAPNLHGAQRFTCRLCGECDFGCNYGAKNTLDFNYLTSAELHGAAIRTRSEVIAVAPRDGGGYTIRYRDHRAEAGEVILTAERLILGAGALGSTYLLLRNRAALPKLSARLGDGFTGNGDLVAWAVRCSDPRAVRDGIDPAFGPVITTAALLPEDGLSGSVRGFVEDGGCPAFVAWAANIFGLPRTILSQRGRLLEIAREYVASNRRSDVSGDFAALVASEMISANMPLLFMGQEAAIGQLRLRGDRLYLRWRGPKRRDPNRSVFFQAARGWATEIGAALGARGALDPLARLRRTVTAHPLGGCRMADSHAHGVVDAGGQVFGYDGLYVADGSIVPSSLGANPSLTIAALSDRIADRILREVGADAGQSITSRAQTRPSSSM